MTEEEILNKIADPTAISEPSQAQQVIAYLSGLITDMETKELELRLLASAERSRIASVKKLSDAKTKVEWELSKEYKEWWEMVLKVRQFKRHRQDINKKYEVICGIKRSY